MTADAKVGLLLGLFFIVVIAFLVNGLPNFIRQEKPSPPGVTITTPTQPDMPLDNAVSNVHRFYRPRGQQRTTETPQEEVVSNAPPTRQGHIEIPEIVFTPPSPPAEITDAPVKNPVVVEAAKAQTHVVQSGENLPVIAKTYYGEEDGNRRIVIQKLYEANKKILKSPDRVCVGDKLTIPSLDKLLNKPKKVVAKTPNPSETLLDKFSNILERVGEGSAKSVSEYVVQEGDSLWAIAQHNLGDGKRYADIIRLNKDKIKSADDVSVGIRLKLPSE